LSAAEKSAQRIIEEVRGIGCVTHDVSSKALAAIEWEWGGWLLNATLIWLPDLNTQLISSLC
jgi:hypothetical protein